MTVRYRYVTTIPGALSVLPVLSALDTYYPDIQSWFINRVVPGIHLGGDPLLVAERHDEVIGIGIGRRGERPKLRCIRIVPAYVGRGIGLHLMDHMLKSLQCDMPVTTVAPELFEVWARPLIERYGFKLDHVSRGRFRPGKVEYEFNTQ